LGLVKKDKQLDESKLCSFLLNLQNKDVHLILAQILIANPIQPSLGSLV
jgi:hypothetical protein